MLLSSVTGLQPVLLSLAEGKYLAQLWERHLSYRGTWRERDYVKNEADLHSGVSIKYSQAWGECSFSPIHTQVVWGLQGWLWEVVVGEMQGPPRLPLIPGAAQGSGPHPCSTRTIVTEGKGPCVFHHSKFKELKALQVSSHQRTPGGPSVTSVRSSNLSSGKTAPREEGQEAGARC